MLRLVRAIAVAAAIAVLTPVLAGCLGDPESAGGDARPRIAATFYPLGFLAERIGGDAVTVDVLVPPGVEPHDWEPSTRDVTRISGASLLVHQGAGFEPWLDGLLANLGNDAPPTVDATVGVELLKGNHDHAHEDEHEEDADHANESHEAHDAHANESEDDHDAHANESEEDAHEDEESTYDPHTWLDPLRFAQQARVVEAALALALPEHAAAFEARADALVADLEALDADYSAALAECEERVIIANHDAYSYLATRYDFDVVAISGLAPEAEPDPQTVARVVDEARAHNVTIVFFEELVSPSVAQIIASEVGAETRVLSPIEGLTPDAAAQGEDYFTLQRANLANLAEAMRCQSPS